jgi:hypothetical protein
VGGRAAESGGWEERQLQLRRPRPKTRLTGLEEVLQVATRDAVPTSISIGGMDRYLRNASPRLRCTSTGVTSPCCPPDAVVTESGPGWPDGCRLSAAARRAQMNRRARVEAEGDRHVAHALLRREEARQPRLEGRIGGGIVLHPRKELRGAREHGQLRAHGRRQRVDRGVGGVRRLRCQEVIECRLRVPPP